MNVLFRIVQKEFLQLFGDRRMIGMLFMTPVIQILIFGFAANNDVNRVPMVLADRDRTAESRRLVERFLSSGWFEIVGDENDADTVEPWLVRGKAQIALVIGEGFGKKLLSGRVPDVQVIADGTDSTSAVVGLGYASRIVASAGIGAFVPGSPARIEIVPRVWYNPDLKSRWFYLPAILAMVLLLLTMVMPSMAVVREKEIGTLEQLVVTPARPSQMIVGKLFPFALIGIFNICLFTGVIVFLFGVPLRGSFWVLLAFSLPMLLTMLGLGLLVSTAVRTQQQAMMLSMFAGMLPQVYLSGLIFPIENMPVPIQWLTYAIPLRYYATILRGVFLKGSGVAVLWPEALTLAVMGVAVVLFASMRFRKNLD